MPIDDKKLMADVFEVAEVDPKSVPLVETFIDPLGNVWVRREYVPKMGSAEQPPFRVVALFASGDDGVTVYSVPTTGTYPADAFRRFTLHRISPSILIEKMTEEVFKEEIEDELVALEEAQLDIDDPEPGPSPNPNGGVGGAVGASIGIERPVVPNPQGG
jgi:hypothetical protein